MTEDGLPQDTGALVITDDDAGQASFVAQAAAAGTYGTFSITAQGNWSYSRDNSNPAVQALSSGDTLTDSFSVASADGSATETVSILINGDNDAPVANDDSATVGEDGSVLVDVLANDTDVDGVVTILSVDTVTNGSAEIENGQIRFTPDDNFNGAASFTYTIADDKGVQASAGANVTVTAVNDAPELVVPQPQPGGLDGAASTLSGLFGNVNDGAKFAAVRQATEPSHLVITDGAGTEVFAGSVAGSFRTTGVPGEVAQLDNGDVLVTWVEGRHTIYGRLFDEDGTPKSGDLQLSDVASFVDQTSTVSALPDGGFAVTNKSWNAASYGLRIRTFDETGAPDGPSFDTGADSRWGVQSSTVLQNGDIAVVFTNDDDADNVYQNGLVIARQVGTTVAELLVDSEPSAGVTLNNLYGRDGITTLTDGTIVAAVVGEADDGAMNVYAHRFNPDGTRAGDAIQVADWSGNTFDGQRKPDVVALADGGFAVVFANERSQQTDAEGTVYGAGTYLQQFDAAGMPVGDPVFINHGTHPRIDLDAAGALTVTTYGANGFGGITSQAVTTAQPGIATLEDVDLLVAGISVSDVDASEGNGQLQVEVSALNGLLTATADGSAGVTGDATATLQITGAVVEVSATRASLTYSPNACFNGTETLQVSVSDQGNAGTGGALTVSQPVEIEVAPQNDAPVVTDDSASTDEDATVSIAINDLLSNDSDPDLGDVLVFDGLDTSGTQGAVTVNGDGTLTYDPDGAFDGLGDGRTGSDSFVYRVRDGNGAGSVGTVNLSINGVDNQPAGPAHTPNLVLGTWSGNDDAQIYIGLTDADGDGVPNSANTVALLPMLNSGGNRQIQAADLDGDGDADFVIGSQTSAHSVSVLFNHGDTNNDGVPEFAAPMLVATGALTYGIELSDLDGDGDTDIVATGSADRYLLNLGDTNNDGQVEFGPARAIPGMLSSVGFGAETVADFNGDGYADIAVSQWADRVQIAFGQGDQSNDGVLEFAPIKNVQGSIGNGSTGLASGDLDGDGDLDYVVQDTRAPNGSTTSSSVVIGLNQGDTNNDGVIEFAIDRIGVSRVGEGGIEAGDIDGDGDVALVIGKLNAAEAAIILENLGDTDNDQRPEFAVDLLDNAQVSYGVVLLTDDELFGF